ncbi:HlyU family transcriptional regulator [Ovoidimarina sediminis]|uniref:HlyU family transcriptional regulator n=1 Tax=Ovoidimarina sediminis TaxID=3079856 RepID=UPI00291565E5|nr:HlyU family transcriptional regulator [Rhodophyticola sp. MJ-SS7]MDU8942112.1 HlyU family transcriptional regulator [Rhodophyticola sp. MJ-SS7]
MSLLSKLFGGGGSEPEPRKPEIYKDFSIFPDPMKEGSRYRIAARIEKEIGGEVKVHRLIRADTLESLDAAVEASLGKAKTVIDQQGERVFD